MLPKTQSLWSTFANLTRSSYVTCGVASRQYAKTPKKSDKCRQALVDMADRFDHECPKKNQIVKKKKRSFLYKIKMKITEGGTHFGTPFRSVECKTDVCSDKKKKKKSLPAPAKKKALPIPKSRPGVQVSVLGAETTLGQNIALLLKRNPCIRKLRLFEASGSPKNPCNRDLCSVVQDLKHINTNCHVEMFKSDCSGLERCLQNTDIVLMLDNDSVKMDIPLEKRFNNQAPIVKRYADVIATECPRAFTIVCASPIECNVPLIAEILKQSGWYDPRKLMGSLAVPEMRASTLAARALSLEPRYTRVPCVGGTEGESLVPLFSKAVDYFEFTQDNAVMLTETIRNAPLIMAQTGENSCSAKLSEAHALAGLVGKAAQALLCLDMPVVTGFVETDANQVISPARFIANSVRLTGVGIKKNFGIPKLSSHEVACLDRALYDLSKKMSLTYDWFKKTSSSSTRFDTYRLQFFSSKMENQFYDCAYANA